MPAQGGLPATVPALGMGTPVDNQIIPADDDAARCWQHFWPPLAQRLDKLQEVQEEAWSRLLAFFEKHLKAWCLFFEKYLKA